MGGNNGRKMGRKKGGNEKRGTRRERMIFVIVVSDVCSK